MSAAVCDASEPPNLPMGVRTAEIMKTSATCSSYFQSSIRRPFPSLLRASRRPSSQRRDGSAAAMAASIITLSEVFHAPLRVAENYGLALVSKEPAGSPHDLHSWAGYISLSG